MRVEVISRRVYRTGVQTIERRGDRFFLTIKNRTYASEVEILPTKVDAWVKKFAR